MTTTATKARPPKEKPPAKAKRANLVEAMNSAALFRPFFPLAEDGRDTWWGWKVVAKAMDALPMTAAEIEFFKSIAGGREPPAQRVSEFVAVCARRTGKDSFASAIAAIAAATFDQQHRLRPGERVAILCLACDRDQSRIILGYIRSYFRDIPALAAMVERETKDGFALNNGVDIVVATNNFKSIRGRPILLVILDEAAFYASETSASPDRELYAALRPGMLTIPGSRMIIISSPYRRAGLLWDRYRKYFGTNDNSTLVIQSDLRTLNPTISQAQIDAETEEDPASAVSEIQGQFRDDIAAFLTLELIEAAVDRSVTVRAPQQGVAYHCGVDPSGGVSDSFTAAISHADKDNNIILDALLEIKAPFDPDVAVEQVAALIKSYGINTCTGDKYAAQFVVAAFAKHGVSYRHSERDRSKIYADVLPLFTSGRARLLDTPKGRLVIQYAGLQRETTSMGRDKIDHGPGQKDDLCNAASLAMVLASSQKPPMFFAEPFVASRPRTFPGGASDLYSSMRPGGWPADKNPNEGY
jgi:hypothetical protein